MEPAIIILLIVFALIAIRQIGGLKFRIWQVMLFGAMAVVITGQITLFGAVRSINSDVMIFLLAMFIVGEALSQSGYLLSVSSRFIKKCSTLNQFLFVFVFMTGLFSAILMNDTMAVICTPIAVIFSRRLGVNPKMLLLSLCFAITTGSVLSPIGNPQNLLVATESGFSNPFGVFLLYLGVPTVISLLFVYLSVRLVYRADLSKKSGPPEEVVAADPDLAKISGISLIIIFTGVILMIFLSFRPLQSDIHLPLTIIAIAGALPVIIFSKKRMAIIRGIDWRTLVFFASMFILMGAVYATGYFQGLIPSKELWSVPVLFSTGVIISQFISNVPFVALFTPFMIQSGIAVNQTAALAAGSTIAGNLTILGAASNVIVIQQAERYGETLSFFEFLKIGLPLTVITSIIYIVWLIVI